MRGFIGLLVAGFWLCLPTSGAAQNYAPRNECAEIEGADEFRMQLAMAIANRNTAMLMPLVSEDVLLDFGGGRGLTELRKRLDHPNYLLWEELEQLQTLGCGARDGQIYLPWYWGEDLGTEDVFSTVLVMGNDVPLQPHRDGSGTPSAMLNWEVVTLLDDWVKKPIGFAQVETASGQSGYVPWSQLRAQVDYRMIVENTDEGWQVTALVAGD